MLSSDAKQLMLSAASVAILMSLYPRLTRIQLTRRQISTSPWRRIFTAFRH